MTATYRCLSLATALFLGLGAISGGDVRAEGVVGSGMIYKQAVAAAAAPSRGLAAFYRDTDYAPVWTATDDAARERRAALMAALTTAGNHGLPEGTFGRASLLEMMADVRRPDDRGEVEVALSQAFLAYAHSLQSGILEPARVDSEIKRERPRRDDAELLRGIATSDPNAFLRGLAPSGAEYNRLMRAKLDLERQIALGGWGPRVPDATLEAGDTGRAVVALRDRLVRMGYLGRSVSARYDTTMTEAVRAFQADHGLAEDGVAGSGTMAEINVPMERRLQSVIVAMERERWLNVPRGDRHVLVNLADFSARIVDFDKVTFQTRAVIGKNESDRRSPEFSDEMEHMVINPTWNVPRSIATKEYLPSFQRNPNASRNIVLVDSRGRQVPRHAVNFSRYNARTFPFDLKEPPSQNNALGLVKFMFPNRYNIYLHDTPSKSLFDREKRDFSHGCIRLQQPFDFAYALLAPQVSDPEGFFQAKLRTGNETRVPLAAKVPVHLIYRTAVAPAKGRINFRRDVYGRDATIWSALERAGVVLRSVQG